MADDENEDMGPMDNNVEQTDDKMLLMDKLWKVWKDYIDYYVVENRELKTILFHTVLGAILRYKGYSYIESAKQKSMRQHIFMVQDSGTGKTQLMTALTDLISYLGIPCRRTIKDNEAALTGTVYRDVGSGKTIKRKGALADLYSLCWDEGSVLLKSSAYMDIVTDVMQGVMDEPGIVSKGMRLGTVEYPSPATIIAGSYMFDAFETTLVTKGFLQRMFIFFKIFSEREKRNIRIGVNLLKNAQNVEKIERIKEEFRKLVDKIPILVDKNIVFNMDDVKRFDNVLEDVYKKYIEYQFVGEKQKVLETFFNRLHTIIDKVAAQRAIINGKTEVEFEDMEFGLEISKYHLTSLLELFDYLYSGKILTYKDEREQIIAAKVKANGGEILQVELINQLLELKKVGKWDLGFNRTLQLIRNMISEHKVAQTTSDKKQKIILLK
jgi:hypothetical protein